MFTHSKVTDGWTFIVDDDGTQVVDTITYPLESGGGACTVNVDSECKHEIKSVFYSPTIGVGEGYGAVNYTNGLRVTLPASVFEAIAREVNKRRDLDAFLTKFWNEH